MRTPRRLDDWVRELFAEEPVTMRAIRMETEWWGEKIEGVQFTPSIAGDQAGRLRQLLNLTGDKLPVTYHTAGFFPRVGKAYSVRVRFKPSRTGRGGVVLAFPAERRKLRSGHEWRPGLYVHAGKMTFVHQQDAVWMSRHPETGQVVLTWGHVKMENPRQETRVNPRTHKPETLEVCDVDMSPYVLRPSHTGGFWVAGHRRELETIDEGAMARYDEALADEQVKRLRSYTPGAPAPEFEMFGMHMTPFEIYGTPEPAPSTHPEQLVKNVAAWVKKADGWRRQGLAAVLHEDRFPEAWDPEKGGPKAAATRTLALNLAEQARQGAEAAFDWVESLAVHLDRKLAALQASGLPPAKKDFVLPKPKRRPTRRIPLIALALRDEEGRDDETLTRLFHNLVRHGGQWPAKKPAPPPEKPSPTEASAGPAKAKTTKRQRQAAAATPHVEPPRTRTAATYGEVVPHTVGDHMPKELRAKAKVGKRGGAKPAKKEKKAARKSRRTLPCNECGKRHLAPEGLEGKVLEQCPPKAGKKKG